jgi:hypothetical protein
MAPMRDDDPMIEQPLERSLRDAVASLRAERDVPELWRARVLQEVRRASVSRRRRRRIVLAAASLIVVLGGSALIAGHRSTHVDVPAVASVLVEIPPDAAPVRYTFDAPGARRVALVGDFDAWSPSGRPMRRSADGRTWELSVALPPGRHAFAYLVDGILRVDPNAARAVEDDFGVPSSVIVIASGRT